MCGIAFSNERATTDAMLERLGHRGKDARVVKSFVSHATGLGGFLGHNRLAIVDLTDAGLQPLETAQSIIGFVGEIFNYEAIYKGLQLHHRVPCNEIHTLEYLLREHEQFDRILDGYYAIVRIDKSAQTITLARDLIGVVPLYYRSKAGLFQVASEKKAFDAPGAREVMPGETLVFDFRGRRLKRRCFDPYSLHLEDMDLDHLGFLFRRAVCRRVTHSEKPVCVALSGGLDSSMVLKAAVEVAGPEALHAITVCVDADSEEVSNAQRFARLLGVPHKVVSVGATEIEQHRDAILYHLEDHRQNPIKYGAMIRNYFTAMHAPGTVVLCGEGADEIGCGYPSHRRCARFSIELEWKSLSTLRSMHAINLDRVNKGGMAFTKEFRTPFLDRSLVLYLMGCAKSPNKGWFRELCRHQLEIPEYILNKPKYTSEESCLWQMVEGWSGQAPHKPSLLGGFCHPLA